MNKLYAKMAVDGQWQYAITRRSHNRAVSQLASWHGAIETEIKANPNGSITYQVREIPWQGIGQPKQVANGTLKGADQ